MMKELRMAIALECCVLHLFPAEGGYREGLYMSVVFALIQRNQDVCLG